MTDYAELYKEATKKEYDGWSDDDIAAALRVKTVTYLRPIPAGEIKRLWGRRMILARCAVLAGSDIPLEARVLCRATYDNLMGDLFSDLDPSNADQTAEIEAYLAGLVAAGAMSLDEKQATLDLAKVTKLWPEAHGFALDMTGQEIAAARLWHQREEDTARG